jgi:membrane dipeptidase
LLKKLGLRSIGVTWNYNNKYGSGCLSKKDYGLTPEGEELVRTANKLGVIVDLAHASKRTALEAIDASSKPVIISHANIRRIIDTPRNVDDEVLEALYKKRGVIGISAIGPLVSTKPKPALDDLPEHFLYVYETYGAEILAIGTDFHGLIGLPAPDGFESISRVQVLLEKLRERGLSESDIEKIAYRNALRVITENFS